VPATTKQWLAIVVVVGVVVASVFIALGYFVTETVSQLEDVSASVSAGAWQDGTLAITVGEFPLDVEANQGVVVVLANAEGAAYYIGHPSATQSLPDTNIDITMSYLDADGDMKVSQGDRMTIVVEPAAENPLVGGKAYFAFDGLGYGALDLP
jgi:hypothetical protein